MTDETHYLGLLEISQRIRNRSITAEAVTTALLQRIDRLNPRLHCYLAVFHEEALKQARHADTEIAGGFWRGPLHGVPIGVKDILHMKGLPTSSGMDVLRDFPATEDATVVTRLKTAGAVIMGKLHMTEGAGLVHHPKLPPAPVNPWHENHWSGVSSSGSGVAVAAGLCYGAIGTDTGGSIRLPSFANGLTGIKPTWGRVSRHGLVPLIESLDHVGPMARSIGDAAAILQVIAGDDPKDPTSLADPVPNYARHADDGIGDTSIGIDPRLNADATPEIQRTLDSAVNVLRELGCRVREVSLPAADMAETSAWMMAETAVAHAPYFPKYADRYSPWLKHGLETGQKVDGLSVAKAHLAGDRFRGDMHRVFRDVNMLLVPVLMETTPTLARFNEWANDMALLSRAFLRNMSPFNLTGLPSVVVPAGFSQTGLPLGVQLVANRLEEGRLCAVGQAFQRATGYHTRHPVL